MSNYVDPDATRPVVLGECRCPGKPHTEDTADVVVRFGYGQLAVIYQSGARDGVWSSYLTAILLGVKRWNLVLPDGSARPIDHAQVARLSNDDVDRFMSDDILGPAFAREPVPKASNGRSRNGQRATDTYTPTAPTPPRSMTD